jgi:glycosyltransferase involved in cell wall biosynthesis
MPRLLILSPHFPPSNAADHQRIRMYLPYLLELGWSITVLAVDARDSTMPQDPLLAAQLSAAVRVIRVRTLPLWLGRLLGSRSLSWRARGALRRAGDRLLRGQQFDLLYVSTTQFGVCRLALHWLRRFGLRYVFDLQDPWISDHHQRNPDEPPPGGRLKYALSQAAARRWEPRVLSSAAAITVVASQYREQLLRRYSQLDAASIVHLPFGVDTEDFALMQASGVQQSLFDPTDGLEHWVYVGRGGADLAPALRPLFEALALWRQIDPPAAARVRLHFIGTSYAPADQAEPSIAPLAHAANVGDLVDEHPARISYLQALRCMADASALLLPASTDAAYQPSKLHLCLLAGRPLLALVHRNGPLAGQLGDITGVCVVEMGGDGDHVAARERILSAWLRLPQQRALCPQAKDWLQPHTAGALALRLHNLFQQVLRNPLVADRC